MFCLPKTAWPPTSSIENDHTSLLKVQDNPLLTYLEQVRLSLKTAGLNKVLRRFYP